MRKHGEHEYHYAHSVRREPGDVRAECAGKEANLVRDLRKQTAAAEAAVTCNSRAQHQHAWASVERPVAPVLLRVTGDDSKARPLRRPRLTVMRRMPTLAAIPCRGATALESQ